MNKSNLNPAIAAVGETVATEIKLFRSAAVTSENRATPFARSILGSLVAATSTPSLIESMVIHAFGNPMTPKGKAIDKLSGSGDYLPGWGATRKTVASIFDVFANIDADAPRNVEGENGETTVIGAGEIRDVIVAFILNTEGAPKSLRALRETVRAKLAAFAALLSPDNAEAEAEAEEAAANETPSTPTMTLTERVEALIVAYEAATPEARVACHDAMQVLFLTVNADVEKEADPAPVAKPEPVLQPAE